MSKLSPRNLLAAAGGLALAASVTSVAAAPPAPLQTSLRMEKQITNDAAESQEKVDRLADQTQELLEEYLMTRQQTDRTRVYNNQMEKLIRSQNEEMQSIRDQMEEIEQTEREIMPLMIRMIDALEQFVKLDIPFRYDERIGRVERLREMMDRSDVTISEKYRQIMEAYQNETEYARTIGAYRGEVERGEKTLSVDFFRVGRILLAYQTLDREETGFWNKNTGEWEKLGSEYRDAIKKGIQIARKQAARDILKLPVPAPERVQ